MYTKIDELVVNRRTTGAGLADWPLRLASYIVVGAQQTSVTYQDARLAETINELETPPWSHHVPILQGRATI